MQQPYTGNLRFKINSIQLLFILFLLSTPISLLGNCRYLGNDRRSSFPFISGDTFRNFCDWIVDETGVNFSPSQVKEGDTIFVRTDMVPAFISDIHPLIDDPYILVTHNSDFPIPGPSSSFLEEEKLIAWFGQNVEYVSHPKLHALPIGIANRYWSHGNIDLIAHKQQFVNKNNRPITLYMNFLTRTYPIEREYVYNTFVDKSFCLTRHSVESDVYLNELLESKFVLSPRGNGIDCHRTWEALLMGAIPIVISSSLNPLYEGLPVLVLNNWEEITEKRLEIEWERINSRSYQMDKLYAGYWFDLISQYKTKP